jgi:hypothetical protein
MKRSDVVLLLGAFVVLVVSGCFLFNLEKSPAAVCGCFILAALLTCTICVPFFSFLVHYRPDILEEFGITKGHVHRWDAKCKRRLVRLRQWRKYFSDSFGR